MVQASPTVAVSHFGSLPDGRPVEQVHVTNGSGMSATFITLGAALLSVKCPSARGDVEVRC